MEKNITLLLFLLIFVYLSLLIVWATEIDTEDGFLGGLNWSYDIFNWHPILMSLGFGLFFFQSIISRFFLSNKRFPMVFA